MPKETYLWTSHDAEKLESWVPAHFTFGSWEKCFYCGQPSDCMDHVIPWSFLSVRQKHRGESPGIKTASCRSCNALLSDAFFSSLDQRCEYARQRIVQKARCLLRIRAIWDEKEKREMGTGIRSLIEDKEAQRAIAVNRSNWQSSIEFISLYEDAQKTAIERHPDNQALHEFMRPPWIQRRECQKPENSPQIQTNATA